MHALLPVEVWHFYYILPIYLCWKREAGGAEMQLLLCTGRYCTGKAHMTILQARA